MWPLAPKRNVGAGVEVAHRRRPPRLSTLRRTAPVLFLAALAAFATLPGCTSSGNETAETVFDPCSPLQIALSASVTDAERAGVDAAIAAWNAQLPTQIVSIADEALYRQTPRADDVLPIEFATKFGLRAAYFDKTGVIIVSSELLAPEEYGVAIAHEMGHAFGLPHIDPKVRASVMNVGNTTVAPTVEDAAEVAALWPSCSAGN